MKERAEANAPVRVRLAEGGLLLRWDLLLFRLAPLTFTILNFSRIVGVLELGPRLEELRLCVLFVIDFAFVPVVPCSDSSVSLAPPFLTVFESAKARCLAFASNLPILIASLLSGEDDVTFSPGTYSLSEPSTSNILDGGDYSVIILAPELYNSITA